jgi:ribosomal protein S7
MLARISLIAVLALAPLAARAEAPAMAGEVGRIDPLERTLEVGEKTFFVPRDVADLRRIRPGSRAIVQYARTAGGFRALRVEIVPERTVEH